MATQLSCLAAAAVLVMPAMASAQPATIPPAFHGRWEAFAKDCRDPDSVMKITVSARKIDYLGQTQSVVSVRTLAPQVLELVVITRIKEQDPEYTLPPTRDTIRMSLNGRGMMGFGDGRSPMHRCSR